MKRPKYKEEWGHSFRNKISRLCQGMLGRNDGANTMCFIYKGEVPNKKCKVTINGCIVYNVRPLKKGSQKNQIHSRWQHNQF